MWNGFFHDEDDDDENDDDGDRLLLRNGSPKKVLSLSSSWDHCHRLSRAEFEPAQDQNSSFVQVVHIDWRCVTVLATALKHHYPYSLNLLLGIATWKCWISYKNGDA